MMTFRAPAALSFSMLTAMLLHLGLLSMAWVRTHAALDQNGQEIMVANVGDSQNGGQKMAVFTPFREQDALLLRKLQHDLSFLSNTNSNIGEGYSATTTEQQQAMLQQGTCVPGALERFSELHTAEQSHLAEELWKYCSLYVHGGMYLDAGTAVLRSGALEQLWSSPSIQNAAVLMDSFAPKAVHGSLLLIKNAKSKVAWDMAELLIKTPIATLETSPLLIPRTLYSLIAQEHELQPGQNNNNEGDWFMLSQSCSVNPFRRQTHLSDEAQPTHPYQCPRGSGFCCFVYFGQEQAMLASKSPVLPDHKLSYHTIPQPFHPTDSAVSGVPEESPFISTLKRTDNGRKELESTGEGSSRSAPTFYEQMKAKNCLPSHACGKCLGDKKHGATCETCLKECPCYCKALCHEHAAGKDTIAAANNTFHDIVVAKPRHARDPTRLIPRIVHQTWFEPLTSEKYPNMSRMTQSFQTSGWQYKFYDDVQARAFLDEHFPPQVREAYDSLIPGAFKADLFRYCVLLIRGGVYADVDTMMGPSLDAAIPDDVGFMVPLDEPGKKVGHRMCLWNGFIAAAPGHPFLARAIETIVNNIRQRYTSVDMAQMHCPAPELSIITSFSPLFVAGPCMLGGTINRVLGRHGQTSFEAGELAHPDDLDIPGRTIILNQNKWDMGAHRFTNLEQNLIVLSTDFPNSDDREKLNDYEHYSTTRIKFEIYGIDNVYKDKHRTTEGLLRVQTQS